MIIDSFVSALRNISFPSLPTSWRGRQVTVLTLGALSLGLVTFFLKKIFWKPTPEAPKPNESQQPKPLAKAPDDILSISVITHPVRTPSRSKSESSFAGTHQPISSPAHPLGYDILKTPINLENRSPVLIQSVSFESPLQFSPTQTNLNEDLFPKGSKFYIDQTEIQSNKLPSTLVQNGWSLNSSQDMNSFLLNLNEIGKNTLNFLYSVDFFEGDLMPFKPFNCILSKETETSSIHLNSLYYAYKNFVHQLSLSATKEGDKWIFDVCCTTWNQDPVYPLHIDLCEMNEWVSFVETSMEHRGLSLKTHPLMQNYIGALPQKLNTNTIQLDIENPATLAPIFQKEELTATFGNFSEIDKFNKSNLLQAYLEQAFLNGASFTLMKENLSPQIFRHNDQMFAHLFLQTTDGNVFEVGLMLELVSAKGKDKTFKSVTIRNGFYIEWMKKAENEHPYITKSNAPERTMITGSFLDFSALKD